MLNWNTAFHIACELTMMFFLPSYVPDKDTHESA